MYAITYAPEAKEGLAKLKHSEPTAFKKAVKLLNEIAEHPQTGTLLHPNELSFFHSFTHLSSPKCRYLRLIFFIFYIIYNILYII